MDAPELVVAAIAPFPILRASAGWCAAFGVVEKDLEGCGLKAFDGDLRSLTQSKVAAASGGRDMSDEVTAAMSAALEQRRAIYVCASLELKEARAAAANCPPMRKISLKIEPVYERCDLSEDALPPATQLLVSLHEQDVMSVKEAMSALKNGSATVLSHVGAPYRIAKVAPSWKELFGLDEAGSVGRSLKMIEGPMTQQGILRSLYEGVSSGVAVECQLTNYHMDGRPHINHLRVVPVKGEIPSSPSNSSPAAPQAREPRADSLAAAAAAAGVTHCLWYMDLHEAVTEKQAMSESFCGASPKVMTISQAPFTILDVNDKWCQACVMERGDVLGKSLSVLQGPATEKTSATAVCTRVVGCKTARSHLINYRGDGVPFVNDLKTHPVIDERSGVVKGAVGVLHQSMSPALESALVADAAPAIVLSATYPHTIVHANTAWLDDMVPDFMCRGSVDKAEVFVGNPLSALALVAAPRNETFEEPDCDDLVLLSGGGKPTKVLVARHDIMAGCGEWHDAALAPVYAVTDPSTVTYFVLSLDLSLGPQPSEGKGASPPPQPQQQQQQDKPVKKPVIAPILRRTNEAPVPSLRDYAEDEELEAQVPAFQETPLHDSEMVIDREIPRSCHARSQAAKRKSRNEAKAPLPRSCELPCDTFDSDSSAGEEDGPQYEQAESSVAQKQQQEEESVPWVPLSQRQAPRSPAARPMGLLERTSGSGADSAAHASGGGLLARSCDDAASARSFLSRTCEDSPDTVRALDRLNDSGTVGLDGDGEEEGDDEEEYMDSEEENELLGCRLPPDQLAASLKVVINQRRARQLHEPRAAAEEEGPEENPTKSSPVVARGESKEALKQRTMMLSDQELFQAIADHAPEQYLKREQQEDRSSDGDASSTEDIIEQSPGATDDEDEDEEIDLLRGASSQRASSEVPAAGKYRESSGSFYPNSGVITTIRVAVQDGVAIAPIYDEYLKILRNKGFVESWEWPEDDVLSLQVPYGRVEKATRKSAWCERHAPDLASGHDWWTRLRYLVAVIQLNTRANCTGDGGAPKPLPAKPFHKTETIMMPRGSVTREERDVGLECLHQLDVIVSWTWDTEDAVAVVVDPHRLRAACAESRWCGKWAPMTDDDIKDHDAVEGWGVYWLRLVWLTAHQPAYVAMVAAGDIQLDLETCLCSLHLHGLLPYD